MGDAIHLAAGSINGGRMWPLLLLPTEADLFDAVLLLSLKTGTFDRSLLPPTEAELFVTVLLPPTGAGLFGSRTSGTSLADFAKVSCWTDSGFCAESRLSSRALRNVAGNLFGGGAIGGATRRPGGRLCGTPT